MENAVYATLGWLFGLLAAVLLEYNRTRRTIASLRKAVQYELRELSNRYAAVAFTVALRIRAADQEFLSWFLNVQETYDGVARDEQIVESARLAAGRADQVDAASRALYLQDPKKAPWLKKYPSPALDLALQQIADFTREEQELLLETKTLITMFEGTVDDTREFLRLGFDELPEEAKMILENNQLTLYIQALAFSRKIVSVAQRFVYGPVV
jgi:hypothetical protein